MTSNRFDTLLQRYKTNKITEEELKELEPYSADNAIIMAAGFGLRSLPLSRTVPKGLYVVKGEVLIERQIRQILEAGIKEIIVVVGYLKEKFYYLKEKYGVIIIENDDYYRYNNISSLYAARDYIKRSYICCSDNYFNRNVFEPFVYDSYYSCLYTEGYANEHCVIETDGEYIKKIRKGASNAWYTIGEAFFSKEFSKKFLKFLQEEYEDVSVRKMIWDDFHIRHINDLPLRLYKYDHDTVQEFDTVEDIVSFDSGFQSFYREELQKAKKESLSIPKNFERYNDVSRYNSAITNQHEGRLHLNENTFGPSPRCLEVLKEVTLRDLYEYDMTTDDFLVEKLSHHFSIPQDDIYLHNGSAELIKSVFALTLERGDRVLVPNPGWSYYSSLARENFCELEEYAIRREEYSYSFDISDLMEKSEKYSPKLVVITSPHNPTGCCIDAKSLEELVRSFPESLVLLDEAYYGFCEEDIDVRRLIESYSNIIVSRTFSKYYGLASLRIGFAFCNFKMKPIWGLDLPLFRGSTVARRVASVALDDVEYYRNMSRKISSSAIQFMDTLNQIDGVRAFQSSSNFVPVLIDRIDMTRLKDYLADNGILIRLFENGNDTLARIAVARQDVMNKTATLIKEYLEDNRNG